MMDEGRDEREERKIYFIIIPLNPPSKGELRDLEINSPTCRGRRNDKKNRNKEKQKTKEKDERRKNEKKKEGFGPGDGDGFIVNLGKMLKDYNFMTFCFICSNNRYLIYL
jgi:hypothetical protein